MSALSVNWVTGKRYDLAWYIAPCLAAYGMMFLNVGLAVDALLLWMLWVVIVDGPHLFGTLSRTYFDSAERRGRGRLLKWSLLWFLPGPLLVGWSILQGTKTPFLVFLLVANLWAYWHVVRQHYGFLSLYQRKNGEPAGRDNPIDYWTFYVLLLAPLLSFVLLNPQAREVVMLSQLSHATQLLLLQCSRFAVGAAAIVFLVKELFRWRAGDGRLNLPKHLFLLSVVPLHVVVCMVPAVASNLHLLMFTVLVTFHHGVQYHGIVWFHNRNRYRAPDARRRHGRLAMWFGRSFVAYYAAGLLFTALIRYSSWWFTGMEGVPLGPGPNSLSMISLGAGFHVAELAVAAWWGFALHHYYLDQHIWRVRRDERLRSDLQVA